jgi:hypothetical protein
MVSRAEQHYLHGFTRTQWRDEEHVVAIGPWLFETLVDDGAAARLDSATRGRSPLPRGPPVVVPQPCAVGAYSTGERGNVRLHERARE